MPASLREIRRRVRELSRKNPEIRGKGLQQNGAKVSIFVEAIPRMSNVCRAEKVIADSGVIKHAPRFAGPAIARQKGLAY